MKKRNVGIILGIIAASMALSGCNPMSGIENSKKVESVNAKTTIDNEKIDVVSE